MDYTVLLHPTMEYRAEISPLTNGRVLQYRLLQGEEPLSWSAVMARWRSDAPFRHYFISLLADVPFPAYFWETPPITSATVDGEFGFVIVEAGELTDVRADRHAFSEHFASAQDDASVIAFPNLGGDAMLVAPCPGETPAAYSQLSNFSRQAPIGQQHEFWALVGATLERRLGAQPVWLSTSGLGIYWLHVRLDSVPKYYTHRPYRSP